MEFLHERRTVEAAERAGGQPRRAEHGGVVFQGDKGGHEMNGEVVAKIVKTLLALLGIWAGVTVTNTVAKLGTAVDVYTAGAPGAGR